MKMTERQVKNKLNIFLMSIIMGSCILVNAAPPYTITFKIVNKTNLPIETAPVSTLYGQCSTSPTQIVCTTDNSGQIQASVAVDVDDSIADPALLYVMNLPYTGENFTLDTAPPGYNYSLSNDTWDGKSNITVNLMITKTQSTGNN